MLILNNDTQVAPDFLHSLVWMLNADVGCAAVSSGVLRSDHPELNVLESAYLEIYWGHGIIIHYGVNAPREGFNHWREVDDRRLQRAVQRADALRAIGPFDDSYFAYHEEVDWCARPRAGYRIYWHPYSTVRHSKSTSTSALCGPGRRARARRGRSCRRRCR